ncbi:MAG TPA: EamA family transporter [Candidatus Acidoferrum sp.]
MVLLFANPFHYDLNPLLPSTTNSHSAPLGGNRAPKISAPANRSLILLCFVAVYILWGATYLGMKVGVESFPPHLLSGLRFFIVGIVFYPLFRHLSGEKPTLVQWRTTIVVGVLLCLCGNGTVCWAERIVSSGLAALLVSTVSLWMVLIEWLRPGGRRPAPRVLAGFVLGFTGMVILVGPKHLGGADRIDPWGALALIVASLAWAAGSIYSRHHPLPRSPMLAVGMETLAGGTALLIVSFLRGDLHNFQWAAVSLRSWLGLLYLIVFGSALGFSAYAYLLKHSTAARVATYAFVNPVVALLLGWFLANEPFSLRTILASTVILIAVLLVIAAPHPDPATTDESLPVATEA